MSDIDEMMKEHNKRSKDVSDAKKKWEENTKVRDSELKVRKAKADEALDRLERMQAKTEALGKIDLSPNSTHGRDSASSGFADSIDAIKHRLQFLTPEFGNLFNFCRKNIVTILGPTGRGKSTLTANLAANIMRQGKKVLILSNEERASDVYGRVFCLFKGYDFNRMGEFTNFQKEEMTKFIAGCQKTGALMVIDNSDGYTSTAEHLMKILYRIRDEGHAYDAIIVDYFQAIARSTNPNAKEPWQAQDAFLTDLDAYKEESPAVIALLAQVKPPEGKDVFLHDARFVGRKTVVTVSTTVLEMFTDYDNCETRFYCHKSRFKQGAGRTVTLGWEAGKYVTMDKSFLEKRDKRAAQALAEKTKGQK